MFSGTPTMRSIAAAHRAVRHSAVCLAQGSSSGRALAPATRVLGRAAVPRAPAASVQPLRSLLVARGFAQTAVRPKKGGKEKGGKEKKGGGGGKENKKASSSPSSKDDPSAEDDGHHPAADPADPFNFADVESRWQRSAAHHEAKFQELRRALGGGLGGGGGGGAGGDGAAVDVDAIGRTPVAVRGDADGAAASTVPLHQLALVLPRPGGRVVELRMHSPASRKAIVRAVQTDALFRGQQPQPDPDDELVLLVRMGGAGAADGGGSGKAAGDAEAAAAAERVRRVHDLANAWRAQIRHATARRQKTHQTWKRDKAVQPDDLHRLERDLLKGQEKRMAAIDAAEKDALRQLERRR